MIVALGFGNCTGDTPSVFVVDTDKCSEEWRNAIIDKKAPMPTEWDSLEDARVNLPVLVEKTVFLYYNG
jgi:hypothetical protein